MKPIITITVFMIFIGFSLIYLKDFGWEGYEELLLKGGLQTCITVISAGFLADLITNRD